MKNKMIQSSKNKSKNEQINTNKPLSQNSNELIKYKNCEINSQLSPKINLKSNNQNSSEIKTKNMRKSVNNDLKKKNNLKNNLNENENINNRQKNVIKYNNEKFEISEIEKNKKKENYECLVQSDKNLIKIKNNNKKPINKLFDEALPFHQIDSMKKIKKRNSLKENLNNSETLILEKEEKIVNNKENDNKDKKHYIVGLKNIKDKANKDYKDYNKNQNKEKNNEDIYDDIILNDSEFDNSTILLTKNLQETKFPKLSVNPFIDKSLELEKINNFNNKKSNSNKNIIQLRNKYIEKEDNINDKEKLIINHHLKSSTLGTNNKSSTTNPNSSNLSSTIEMLNTYQNTNFSNKKENSTCSEIEKNNKKLLLLAKNGDREKFLELFDNQLPKNQIDINFKDENGCTALHYSCDEGNLRIVEILLNSNCNLNIKNNKKETPLHLASKRGYFDICRLLIEKGAQLNIYNDEKNSPLHYVCMNNYIELFQLFLNKHPEADKKNIYGKTPLDLTTNQKIKELLQNYLNQRENKFKNISNSKRKYLNEKEIKNEVKSLSKDNISPKEKNPIKSSTSTSPLSRSPKNKVINKINQLNNNQDNQETFGINIKKKNTVPKNILMKMKELNNNNLDKNLKNNNNINNSSKNLKSFLKKTKTIEKFSSSIEDNKDKINKSKIYNSTNKRYILLNESLINKSNNIHESMNNGHNRINISSNKRKENNKSLSKFHKTKKSINTIENNSFQKKSNFYQNNLKTKKLLLDSTELSDKNLINLNKTDENIKLINKKDKNNSKTINNINKKKIETTEKIIAKNKKIKLNKIKKSENSLINNCNISKISCGNNTNNIILDKINKSNIIDKTITENIHNKLNLNSIKEEKITPSNFVCLALLGKGSFGEVYLVRKINSQQKYAMKVLRKEKIMGQNLLKYAIAERNVLSLSHHPFIVKLHFAFQTSSKLFLILEYCPNGDLAKHLLFEKRFSEKRAKFYLCEVLLALENLHKRDIIFRDLKPDNVVLDEEGHCKLTDFGLSKEGIQENIYTQSFCGSIAYLAPEMIKRQGHGKAVDWYLLGVLFYEMLIGVTPFFTLKKEEIFHNIEYGELKIPDFVSKEAAELLKGLLERDPKKRLGGNIKDAEEIKEHPYFKDVNWDDVYNKKLKPPIFMNYMSKMMHVYHRPRLFANDDLFNKTSDMEEPHMLKDWSFINNEEL